MELQIQVIFICLKLHIHLSCALYVCVCVLAVTVEEQIVRQLTEKRLKELSSCISDTRREYQ